MPGKDHYMEDTVIRYPVKTPKGEKAWKPWEPKKKSACQSSDPWDHRQLGTAQGGQGPGDKGAAAAGGERHASGGCGLAAPPKRPFFEGHLILC